MPNCDPDDYVGICSSAADPVIVSNVAGGAAGLTDAELRATPVPVSLKTGATNTRSSVNGAASSTTILALNTGRLGAVFYNDSTAILYLDLSGGTASTSNYSVQVPSQGYFELPVPIYTGAITGIWAAATGAVKVTELSA